jgi:hypothetical protein
VLQLPTAANDVAGLRLRICSAYTFFSSFLWSRSDDSCGYRIPPDCEVVLTALISCEKKIQKNKNKTECDFSHNLTYYSYLLVFLLLVLFRFSVICCTQHSFFFNASEDLELYIQHERRFEKAHPRESDGFHYLWTQFYQRVSRRRLSTVRMISRCTHFGE